MWVQNVDFLLMSNITKINDFELFDICTTLNKISTKGQNNLSLVQSNWQQHQVNVMFVIYLFLHLFALYGYT